MQEGKKTQPLRYNMVQTLNYRGGRQCGRGMALQGEAEERRRRCRAATDVGFRDSHHRASQHGQESSASVN